MLSTKIPALIKTVVGTGLVATLLVAASFFLSADSVESSSQAPLPETRIAVQQSTNGEPELTIAATSDRITEGGYAQFTVSADPAPKYDAPLTVNYKVTQEGEFSHQYKQIWIDQNLGSKTLTMSESSATIIVPTVDDNQLNPDGSVTVTLESGSGYTLGNPSTDTVIREENEYAPTHSLRISNVHFPVRNEGESARFTVQMQPSIGHNVDVRYRVVQNGNFVESSELGDQKVTLKGSTADITVPTVNDSEDESDGTVSILLLENNAYNLGTPNVASVTILDNDASVPVELSISADSDSVVEGSAASFTVSANKSDTDVSFKYTVTQNGAFVTSGNLVKEKTVKINGNSKSISVPTVGDNTVEPNGSVLVTLLPGSDYELGTNVAHTSVTNDDYLAEYAVTVSGGLDVVEGGDANYIFSVSPAPQGSITVGYTVSEEGDVVADSDVGVKYKTLTSSSTEFTVRTDDDSTGEPSGKSIITIIDGDGYRIGSQSKAEVIVHDDDGYPKITLRRIGSGNLDGNDDSTNNDKLTLEIKASEPRNSDLGDHLYVYYKVNDRGYEYTSVVPFPNDATSTTFDVTPGIEVAGYPNTEDRDIYTDGPLTVTLVDAADVRNPWINSGTDYCVDAKKNSVSTTVNAAPAPTLPVVVKVTSKDSTEGSPLEFTIKSYRGDTLYAADLTVKYKVERISDPGSVILDDQLGTKSVRHSGSSTVISIPTEDNNYNDGNATYQVTLENGIGYEIVGTGWFANADVIDDEAPVKITAEVNNSRITEGNSAVFTVKASPAPSDKLTINYEVTQENGDFVATSETGQKTLTLHAGRSSATITIPTIDDDVEGKSGALRVEILSGRGYTFELHTSYPVQYIDDNDKLVKPTVSVTGPSKVTEGEVITYTITSNPAPTGDMTIAYWFDYDGDFINDPESDIRGNSTYTISGASTTIEVPTVDDSLDESDGFVYFILYDTNDYKAHSTDSFVSTAIADNDDPELSIDVGSNVTEGGDVTFTIWSGSDISGNLTVTYKVSQSGDFVSASNVGDKTVTVSGRRTVITIPTIDDNVDESDGSVTVTLQDGTGYDVSSTEGSGTINVEDNDQ